MAIYPMPPPHERLNVFFGEFFQAMRKAESEAYGAFLMRAEEEFKRLGYRDNDAVGGGVANILIVRLDLIGDMILTSGFIREVRANFPRARITLVVSSVTFPLVELCPYVNEVLTLNKNLVGSFVEILEKVTVFCKDNLWQKNFSMAFSPRWYNDTIIELLICWLSGARERIGYGTYPFKNWLGDPSPHVTMLDNFLLTKNILTPQNVISDGERNFYLLVAAGFNVKETHMELWFDTTDLQHAKEMLGDILPNCKKILLGLGASEPNRKYPVEKYLVVLKELAKKDFVFVIVGGKAELDDAEFIEKNMPRGKVLNLVAKTTLRETEAVISQMDFYIGHDTGVLHIAAAAKVPVLGIYREAVDRENILPPILSGLRRFPPWQTKAIILRPEHPLGECATLPPVYGHCHHSEPHCITQITPQQIIDGFGKLQML